MKPIFLNVLLFSAFAHAATVNIEAGGDIQAAVDANPAGTAFQLGAGIYRMQRVTAKDGDQFIGALDPAGNRLTILSGAQSLGSFTKDEFGNYLATTSQTQPGQRAGYCAKGFSRCSLPEDFFYDNEPYVHNEVGGVALA